MADEIPFPDDYEGCGQYYATTLIPNPDFITWQLYGIDSGLDPQDAYIEVQEGPFEGPPCGAPPDFPFPTSFVYNFGNDIRWHNDQTQGGLNSVAPVNNFANSVIQTNAQGGWDHNAKQTKFITELIAMDFGKGEVDSNGQPLAIGMDYRHRSYNGFESSNEGGFATYENNMGFDSPFSDNIINQFPGASNPINDYLQTSASELDYCLPYPGPGGANATPWIQDIKNLTRTNNTFDFGCYPSEFISCSGFNQKNCSLAARFRQIYADERADLINRVSTGFPTDLTAENFKPIVLSNNNLLAWDTSNNSDNNSVNGGNYSIRPLNQFMKGISLASAGVPGLEEDSDEEGFPMGFFFNVAKFIVEYDDSNVLAAGSTQTADRIYRLKAGFKFLANKDRIEGAQYSDNPDAFEPDDGEGIHLGGNNAEFGGQNPNIDLTSGEDFEPTTTGASYQIFSYLHHDLGGPETVVIINYPFSDQDLSLNNVVFSNASLLATHNIFQALDSTYGEITFSGQPNPELGGNDFPNIFHYEFQDNYNLFTNGILNLTSITTLPNNIKPFKFCHISFNFGIKVTDFGADGGLQGQDIEVSLIDQDGNIIKTNNGAEIKQTITLNLLNHQYEVTLTSSPILDGVQPLHLGGKTGFSLSDVINNLDSPSSAGASSNNTNGIQQVAVNFNLPNSNEASGLGQIRIVHLDKPSLDDIPSYHLLNHRGFTFSPVRATPATGFILTEN